MEAVESFVAESSLRQVTFKAGSAASVEKASRTLFPQVVRNKGPLSIEILIARQMAM